jgi:uncharacterized membrane protein SpoIIM required for sporulation
MRFSLAQELSIIGITILAGATYGLLDRQALLNRVSPNPNDFVSLFLQILQTAALIDFLASITFFFVGLFAIFAASQSYGAIIGLIVLDHKISRIIGIISLSIIGTLEITALVAVGIAGFRLSNFIGSKRSDRRKEDLYAYLKLLGMALSISFVSALSLKVLPFLPCCLSASKTTNLRWR